VGDHSCDRNFRSIDTLEVPAVKNINPNVLAICLTIGACAIFAPQVIRAWRESPGVSPVTVPSDDIAATIEDGRSRGIVSAYCGAWAVGMSHVNNLGHYYDARRIADVTLQSASKLPPGLEDFDVVLSKRLENAVGLDPSRTDLEPAVVVFRQVAEELE
jgi:hypothetical protein